MAALIQVNVLLKKDTWIEMCITDMMKYMVENSLNYAIVKNKMDEMAMVTIHETPLQPIFMESCASLYIYNHIEPEIKCGVCGMVYTKNQRDVSYILTVKRRDKLLRFPNDSWTYKI